MKHPWQALILGWIIVGSLLACMGTDKTEYSPDSAQVQPVISATPAPTATPIPTPEPEVLPTPSSTPTPDPEEATLIKSREHPILEGLEIEKKYFPLVLNKDDNAKYRTRTGKVSFVDEEQRTKSGEHFNPEELVGASKTWPMGAIAKCTNLSNDKTVNVQIIDRGPYVEGRILDLSEAAAKKIGLTDHKGVTRCRVEVLAYPQLKD